MTGGGPVSETAESRALSKELKKLGWKFVGPTTVYSFMQAMGLVNDHAQGCAVRDEAEQARQAFFGPDVKRARKGGLDRQVRASVRAS